MKNNKYGYKVCYREMGKTRIKVHLICNSFTLCVWEIQYYENHKLLDRKTKKVLTNPKWYINTG